MAYSYMTAVSDGTLKSMPITFNYMKEDDIVVHQNITRLTKGTDYTINNNIITFAKVIPALDRIAVDRMSQRDSLRVNFVEGATFSRDNIDDVLTQLLYLTQEAVEGAVDRISPTGILDLAGNRIINLGDPIDLQDAVPLHLVVDAEKSIYASEAKCKQYRDEALGYKDEAFTYADRAYASELNAKKSEDNAKESEINAANSAASILGAVEQSAESAAAAKVSETNAKESEMAAKDSADIAAAHSNTVVDALAATGNVPVGTIAMIANNASEPPAGWLFCGTKFDKAEYPALARLFPFGEIPSFEDRFPMGAGKIASVGVQGQQQFPRHAHSMNFVANLSKASETVVTYSGGAYSGTTQSAGEHTHTYAGYSGIKMADGGGPNNVPHAPQTKTSSSSGTHTHTFSVPAHTHTVVIPEHKHSIVYHGDTGLTGDHSYAVLPNYTGVKYIIKAYESSIGEAEAREMIEAYDLRIVKVEGDVAEFAADIDKAVSDAKIATSTANEAATLANKAVSDANIAIATVDESVALVNKAVSDVNKAITTADESVALANKALADIDGYANTIYLLENGQSQLRNAVSSLEGRVTVLEQSDGGSGGSGGSGGGDSGSGSGGGGANEPWAWVPRVFQNNTATVSYAASRYSYQNAPLNLNYCNVLWRWEDDRRAIRIKGRMITRELDCNSTSENDKYNHEAIRRGLCEVVAFPQECTARIMPNQYLTYTSVCGNYPLDIRVDAVLNCVIMGINMEYIDANPEPDEIIPAMDIVFDWTIAVYAPEELSMTPSLLIEEGEHYVPPPVDRPEGMVPTPPVSYLLNKIAALEASLNEVKAKDATTMLPDSSQGDVPQDPVK